MSKWAVLNQKNIPVGPFWVDVLCPAWTSGHNVKFFLEKVGMMKAVFPFSPLETVHEVALKDKEPDTQDADEVKASGEGVG